MRRQAKRRGRGSSLTQCELFGPAEPDSCFSKMFRESTPATAERILRPWLQRYLGVVSAFRKVAGETPVVLQASEGSLSGVLWMRNGSECRSGAAASSLSLILETGGIAPPILVEPESLFRDYPARPGQGQTAPTIPARRTGRGGLGTDFDCDGGLISAACQSGIGEYCTDVPTLRASRGDAGGGSEALLVFGGNNTSGSIDVAPRLGCNESGSGYRLDFESDAMVVHALRADGFDASEDGTGRGTPLIVQSVAMRGREGGATAELSGEVATALRASQGGGDKPHVLAPVYAIQAGAFRENPASGPDGVGVQEGVAYTIEAREEVQSVVAPLPFDTTQISSRDNRSLPQAGDPCHPLAAGAHAPAIAFPANLSGTQCASAEDLSPSLGAKNPTAVATRMRVRRLMPIECERLQGMPDNYTRIPARTFKKQPTTRHFLRYRDLYEKNQDGTWTRYAADGPRYKAIGNGMAVPCMRWIGGKIDWVWRIIGQERAA